MGGIGGLYNAAFYADNPSDAFKTGFQTGWVTGMGAGIVGGLGASIKGGTVGGATGFGFFWPGRLKKPPITKIGKPKISGLVAEEAPSSALPGRPPKAVYHQGDLSGGVSGFRPFSTSPNPDLTHYRPDGKLYRFDIPSDVYDRWLLDGSIKPITDHHLPSGITRPEIRIMPPASRQMNEFLVPPSGG